MLPSSNDLLGDVFISGGDAQHVSVRTRLCASYLLIIGVIRVNEQTLGGSIEKAITIVELKDEK